MKIDAIRFFEKLQSSFKPTPLQPVILALKAIQKTGQSSFSLSWDCKISGASFKLGISVQKNPNPGETFAEQNLCRGNGHFHWTTNKGHFVAFTLQSQDYESWQITAIETGRDDSAYFYPQVQKIARRLQT